MDVFGGAPRFLAYPRPLLVQSGTDAVLKCQIGGDPRPAVIWERNNEKIDPQGRYRVFEDGNVYNLIIAAVTMEDSGQYICKAKNSIGETYAAATLRVEGEAQEMELREENKPRFLIKPLSTRAGRGEDAGFSCKIWGSPKPDVVWEKDGKKLNEIFESTHFSVGSQDGGWFQLKIFKTRAPDGGVYTCKARNEFGEALAGAVLLVDAGPGHEDEANSDAVTKTAKVKMFAVTEGKHAKFRCFVTGKPKPEIIWRKDGRLILSGRRYLLYEDREGYFTLKVLYCKQKDNGVYVCAASNSAGQTLSAVHLSVKEPPVRFKQPLIDLEVWERDLAVLECEVPEDSVPITWYLEDRRLQPGDKYGMEQWGTKRRLTIRDIGVDDDGIYLCEMPDGGRSIAEVAVKGTIMRKLPRKVDVLEGENAAFCVEVEEEEMDIHWYKDGVELRETHQTILKSFGRTHILVFVNTNPQDTGQVIFLVGRSKTSSQLRVKAARHCPPSAPVGVQINTERANAALLSWIPAQDTRKNPPSGYVLERQEVGTGSQEWLQCLTTDSATSVEILGDSVPCEADYRFRICSVNKYGKSINVEFPRTVHLVPVARIQAPLQDALVPEGQEALFSIELTASVIGTWFLNGSQVQEDERFSMRRTRTHQSLRIRGVRDTDNGAEITFIAYGIRDSAALYIQGFSPLSEMDRNKFVEMGNPIVLYCELSDPPVTWFKDGVKLSAGDGLQIQSEGSKRRLTIASAAPGHSGEYSCHTATEAVRFTVDVKAPLCKFSALSEAEQRKTVMEGSPLALQCELSDASGQVTWYKDGATLLPDTGVDIQTEGHRRSVFVPSVERQHSGVYRCQSKDDDVQFTVDIQESDVFSSLSSIIVYVYVVSRLQEGSPVVLRCQLSEEPSAEVSWSKDGEKVHPDDNTQIQEQGLVRSLTIHVAEQRHSGIYLCSTNEDKVQFEVAIKEPPVMIVHPKEDVHLDRHVPEEIILSCELSRANGAVSWFKDGQKLQESENIRLKVEGPYRRLKILSSRVEDSGEYVCDTDDDSIFFQLNITEPPVRIVSPSQPQMELCQQTAERMVLSCEISRPNAVVRWYRNGLEVEENQNLLIEEDGVYRRLIIPKTTVQDSAEYVCDTADDSMTFFVNIAEPPVRFVRPRKTASRVERAVGESVALDCEVSRASAEVTWKRNGEEVEESRNISLSEEGVSRQLTIHCVTAEDAGQYVCDTGKLGLTSVFLVPAEPPVQIVGNSGAPDLTLSAELSREQNVRWLKDGGLLNAENIHISSSGPAQRLTLHPLQLGDSGEYVCEASHDHMGFSVTVKDPRVVEFIAGLRNVTVREGEGAVFKCVVSPEDTELVWQINGQPPPSQRATVTKNGTCHTLRLSNCSVGDSGRVSADAEGQVSRAELHVQEQQVVFTRPMRAVTAEEFGEALLEVEVSEDSGEVQWMRQGVLLHAGHKYSLLKSGRTHSLRVHTLALSDSGRYSCETLHDRTQAQLTVQRECFRSDRRKSVPGLSDVRTTERETASFEVHLSHPGLTGTWFKNGTQIKPGAHFRISSKNLVHSLTICNLSVEDTGTFTFSVENLRTTGRLVVKEPPVTVFRKLEDQRFPEGAVISIECELSRHNVDVRWLKNGAELKPSKELRIYAMGRKRFLQVMKCKVSDSGVYTCDAGDATTSCSVEVYGKYLRGTKHFLLMCNVRPEDSGEIKFVARHVASVAALDVEQLPVNIVKPLEDRTVLEKTRVLLDCMVSTPRCSCRWYKGVNVILPSERFEICSEGCTRKLIIQQVALEDEGTYSVQVGESSCSAKLTVEGTTRRQMFKLH
uniref:Obscurin-like protein 1 n=1 Tax=Neogobius melanostomus TaxID=47308 RepID=A0A8C6SFW8_9GOBI